MIVADTGAVLALLDADDRHHAALSHVFSEAPAAWILPWAILPEVDCLATRHLGARVAETFHADIASGAFTVEWGHEQDLARALEIRDRHAGLHLDLVDAIVIAMAERLRVSAIATLDLRDFGAVAIIGQPRLLPRDL